MMQSKCDGKNTPYSVPGTFVWYYYSGNTPTKSEVQESRFYAKSQVQEFRFHAKLQVQGSRFSAKLEVPVDSLIVHLEVIVHFL